MQPILPVWIERQQDAALSYQTPETFNLTITFPGAGEGVGVVRN